MQIPTEIIRCAHSLVDCCGSVVNEHEDEDENPDDDYFEYRHPKEVVESRIGHLDVVEAMVLYWPVAMCEIPWVVIMVMLLSLPL
eukprot:scaffold406424_cov63-Attheya_sp.AAC.1